MCLTRRASEKPRDIQINLKSWLLITLEGKYTSLLEAIVAVFRCEREEIRDTSFNSRIDPAEECEPEQWAQKWHWQQTQRHGKGNAGKHHDSPVCAGSQGVQHPRVAPSLRWCNSSIPMLQYERPSGYHIAPRRLRVIQFGC
jgi:hypothetical protein